MARVFQLRKDLSSLTQSTLSITAYFTKFRTMIAEIDTLSSMPKCICASCNCACESAKRLEKYVDMLKLSQFLMGLNDQYTSVRGQLLMMQPVPSISQAFSLLLQEESQREFAKLSQTPLTDSMALTVKYNNLSKFKSTGQPFNSQRKPVADVTCDYCHTAGHTRDKCFCLHGYPEWHKLYGKPKPKPRKAINSQTSAQSVKSAAQVFAYPNSSTVSDVTTENSVNTALPFSDAQCQQLSKMIQESIRQTSNWNLNSSSNSQMTGTDFCNINSSYSCSVVSVNSVSTPDNS